mmetsp:Transcript_11710/g.30523  ORF Transcript_11710/g.30523 Transcript_11710/m.30523 type:complete len:254 (-) Transcript_11710:223-984(-)
MRACETGRSPPSARAVSSLRSLSGQRCSHSSSASPAACEFITHRAVVAWSTPSVWSSSWHAVPTSERSGVGWAGATPTGSRRAETHATRSPHARPSTGAHHDRRRFAPETPPSPSATVSSMRSCSSASTSATTLASEGRTYSTSTSNREKTSMDGVDRAERAPRPLPCRLHLVCNGNSKPLRASMSDTPRLLAFLTSSSGCSDASTGRQRYALTICARPSTVVCETLPSRSMRTVWREGVRRMRPVPNALGAR